MAMDEAAMKEEFKAQRAAEAATNPRLQNVPAKFRSLLQAFDKAGGGGSATMDISKTARPEEIEALTSNGWDGKSPLPIDVARQLKLVEQNKDEIAKKLKVDVATTEETLAKLENQQSLSIDDLEITPLEQVDDPQVLSSIDHIQSDQSQQEFAGILAPGNRERLAAIVAQAERKVAPVVYDSSKQPANPAPAPAAAAQPVAPVPPAINRPVPPVVQPKINRATPPPLPTTPIRTMTQPPAGSSTVTPPPMKTTAPAATAEQVAETPAPATATIVCPRCHLDLKKKFTIEPTKEDIATRTLSFGSKIQGGDGRFRKTYSIFGTFQLTFRELLASELKHIWAAETTPIYSQVRAGQEQAAAMILVDRVNLRRHLCGLEKIVNTTDNRAVEMPPLQLWIEQAEQEQVEFPVETALQRMEDYARTTCYGVESVMMAAGRAFNHFEEVVSVLWNNQDFYEGTR